MVWAFGQDASGCLLGEVFWVYLTKRRIWSRPMKRLGDYVSQPELEHFSVPPEELEAVAREREIWTSLLRLLPSESLPSKS